MTSLRGVVLAAVLFAAPAFAADPPGTVKLISNTPFLTEQTTGDTFAQISVQDTAVFKLTGPGKFQVDFRVNLKKKAAVRPINLEVYASNTLLTALRITPRAGRGAWRTEHEFKPSETAGFFLQLEAGVQEVMFRIDEAAAYGGAVNIVEASEAKHPLAANSPVLPVPVQAAEGPPAETSAPPKAPPSPPPTPPPSQPVAHSEPTHSVKPAEPQKTEPPPAKVEANAKPEQLPSAAGESPAAPTLVFMAGGGFALQSELGVFDSAGAAAGLLSARVNLPLHVFARIDYEFRYGTILVPVVGSGSQSTPELRHEVDFDLGWAPMLVSHGDFALQLPLQVGYQLLVFSNQTAPALTGLIGIDAGLRIVKGGFAADAGLGYGFATNDSTPASVSVGSIDGRLRWRAQVVARAVGPLSAFAAYEGESLLLKSSTRIGNAMLAGVVLSFL